MATPVKAGFNPLSQRSFIAAAAFDTQFFSYDTTTSYGSLVPVPGATPGTCPAGRLLKETGRRLYPGANPGITTAMVAVYDEVSFLTGYIDPNSSAFAVYNTKNSYTVPQGYIPFTSTLNSGPPVYTQGPVTGTYIAGAFFILPLYNPSFPLVPYTNTTTDAYVFINPYLANVFQLDITTAQTALTGTIHCFLRDPTNPTQDLVPPNGEVISVICANNGANSPTLYWEPGVSGGFYSASSPIIGTNSAQTFGFALNGVDAYMIGTGSGGTPLPTPPSGTSGQYLYWDGSAWVYGSTNVRMGLNAGSVNQGLNAIAIGEKAGMVNQLPNSIVLNASGNELDASTTAGLYISPVRYDATQTQTMLYNSTTMEVVYANAAATPSIITMIAAGATLLYTSSSPYNWTVSASSGNISVSYDGRYWYAVVNDLAITIRILYSIDAVDWASTPNFTNSISDIAYNGTYWIAVGKASLASQRGVWYSANLSLNFTSETVPGGPFTNQYNTVATNGTQFLIGGTNAAGTAQKMFYGIQGSWAAVTSPISQNIYSVAWNGVYWVAVGRGATHTIAYSTNGTTWTGIGNTIFSTAGYGIAWNGSQWAAVGTGTNIFATCTDPTQAANWTVSVGTSVFPTYADSVVSNGNVWMASTSDPASTTNTSAYSSDGINWVGLGTSVPQVNLTTYPEALGIRHLAAAFVPPPLRTAASGINYGDYQYWNGAKWDVGDSKVAIGGHAGQSTQGAYSVAIGNNAGQSNQGAYSVAIGANAGLNNQWPSSIVINATGNELDASTNSGLFVAPIRYDATQTQTMLYNSTTKEMVFANAVMNLTENFMVAVGRGTNTLAYTYDGVKWNGLGTTVFSNRGWKVAWNGSLWVAVGQGTNTIATSADGINWTGRGTTMFSTYGANVAWNGSLWVAVGAGTNTIATSADGINWTGHGTTIFSNYGAGVAWNGSLWVAGGNGTNSLATSVDGITWTGLGTTIFSSYGSSVAWNGSLWVAGGNGTNTLAYSYDGINWTGLGTTIFSSDGYGIAWNGSLWVAVGLGTNTLATSVDGINWTGLGTTIFSNLGLSVAWNGSLWVAVGSGTNTIATSVDGITWTGLGTTIFSILGCGVASRRVLPYVGTDPIPYSRMSTIAYGAGAGVIGQGTQAVAVGYNAGQSTQGAYAIAIGVNAGLNNQSTQAVAIGYNAGQSTQGAYSIALGAYAGLYNQWPSSIVINATGNELNASTNSGLYIAPIRSDPTQTLCLGYNPSTMEIVTTAKLLVSENFMVAVGRSNNTLAYTYDGVNWIGLGTSIFTNRGTKVAWNGAIWVAVGQGTNSIAYSSDGINWTGIGLSIFTASGTGVAWNGSFWIASGTGTTNTLAYSYDGINWTGIPNTQFNAYNIAWSGSVWVLLGNVPSLSYSPDGFNWTSLGQTIFTLGANGMASNGSLCVAVGIGTNSIATSPDGINWTGITGKSIFSTNGNSVAWNGSLWVAVGAGTNSIAYSYDGITWTGLGTSIFSITGGMVAWNGSLWVAGGGGTNTQAYSYDGINWIGIGSTSLFDTRNTGMASRRVLPYVGTDPIPFTRMSTIGYGAGAGVIGQGTQAVAVGYNAGQSTQGAYAIAIGANAGLTNQSTNSIVINATGNELNASTNSGLFVAPIRYDNTQSQALAYNPTTYEIVKTASLLPVTSRVIGGTSITVPYSGQSVMMVAYMYGGGGGGGAAGGSFGSPAGGGGGGGSGFLVTVTDIITGGITLTYSLGAGGAGGIWDPFTGGGNGGYGMATTLTLGTTIATTPLPPPFGSQTNRGVGANANSGEAGGNGYYGGGGGGGISGVAGTGGVGTIVNGDTGTLGGTKTGGNGGNGGTGGIPGASYGGGGGGGGGYGVSATNNGGSSTNVNGGDAPAGSAAGGGGGAGAPGGGLGGAGGSGYIVFIFTPC